MNTINTYSLFPLIRMLRTGNLFYAGVHTALLAAVVALIIHFGGAVALLWSTPLLLASLAYRELHVAHRARLADQLESGALINAPEGATAHDRFSRFVRRPWWWIPVVNWPWLELATASLFIALLVQETEVSLLSFLDGIPSIRDFFYGLTHPRWELLPQAVGVYAKQTVEIALLGTAMGTLIALPLSVICARNLTSHHPAMRALYYVSRSIMVVIRAVPTFLLGLVFVALVGLGPFPGVLAITVFSTGVMVKLFSESIEAIDPGPLEAVRACGGNWGNMVIFGVRPQATPALVAQLLYCAEINVHSATVLGLIGAEGIGLPIHEYLSALAYDSAAVFIVVTILMTIAIDYGSAYLRARII